MTECLVTVEAWVEYEHWLNNCFLLAGGLRSSPECAIISQPQIGTMP